MDTDLIFAINEVQQVKMLYSPYILNVTERTNDFIYCSICRACGDFLCFCDCRAAQLSVCWKK